MSKFDKYIIELRPFLEHFDLCKQCMCDDDGDGYLDYQLCGVGQRLFDDIPNECYIVLADTLLNG